jgi:hypothetical protein
MRLQELGPTPIAELHRSYGRARDVREQLSTGGLPALRGPAEKFEQSRPITAWVDCTPLEARVVSSVKII